MSDEVRLADKIGTIPDALSLWVERTPDAPALYAEGKSPAKVPAPLNPSGSAPPGCRVQPRAPLPVD